MGTHEARLDRIERTLKGDSENNEIGLVKQVDTCKIAYIKMNFKMNAIIWLFGLIIALGVANIVIGQI